MDEKPVPKPQPEVDPELEEAIKAREDMIDRACSSDPFVSQAAWGELLMSGILDQLTDTEQARLNEHEHDGLAG